MRHRSTSRDAPARTTWCNGCSASARNRRRITIATRDVTIITPMLLSESPTVLPIHRKILAFSFIGWIFDFYDLLLLSFLVASTSLTKDLALSRADVSVLL